MIDFVIETEIARSPADVFAFVTDATKLATWQTNTVFVVPETAGPIALGTRIREVHRAPGGKEFAELVEVVEFEPDRLFGMQVIEGQPIHGRITFDPTERGTRFRFRLYGQPIGIMRLAQPILKPMLKRSFAGFSETLRTVLENPTLER
ncbi:MAG: SRPBCC family protein [Solirubrobacteraceae bacterium]